KVTTQAGEVTRITIRGTATIEHEGVLIVAPLLVVDAGTKGRLEGGVVIMDKKNGLTIHAARADYDKTEQKVYLLGSPHMTVIKEGQKPTLVTCDRIVRDLAESVSILGKDVRVYNDEWSILGDEGRYSDKENTIILDSNPFIFGKEQFLTGKRIVYNVAARNMALDGEVVHLTLNSEGADPLFDRSRNVGLEEFARTGGRAGLPDKKKNSPETGEKKDTPEPGPGFLSADKIVQYFPEKAEDRTEMTGNVLLTRGGLTVKGPALTALGRDFHTLQARSGVEMKDTEQGVNVEAGWMTYDRTAEKLLLEHEPKMQFLKKDTGEVQATLTGVVIERDFKAKETVARGNVSIARDTFSADGELATYKESEGVVVMQGDPSLKRAGGRMRCERILIYPDKNRVLLYNRIRGGMVLEE
ncbi:MAG: hypothetical protein HY042_12795, partial [Spirochaetia bacterium]|nr:hypothetical protein [Spirochaetia bacterium]